MLEKWIKFNWYSRPDWETIWDFGFTICWAEQSVSGRKILINIDIGIGSLYIGILRRED